MMLTTEEFDALEKKGGWGATEPYRAVLCKGCGHRRGQHYNSGKFNGDGKCDECMYLNWGKGRKKCEKFIEDDFGDLIKDMREEEGKRDGK